MYKVHAGWQLFNLVSSGVTKLCSGEGYVSNLSGDDEDQS